MKNLPKEFVLTDFTREEGNEVLRHHFEDSRLFDEWEYLIIEKNDYDYADYEDSLPSFPKISYKEWKEIVSQNVEDKFPEKWYITLNSENISVVNKWRKGVAEYFVDNLDRLECTSDDDVYRVWSEDIEGDGSYYDFGTRECFDGFVEITFDQFKKFVLKEGEPTPMKIDWNKVEQPLIAPVGIGKYFVKIDGNDLREIYENSNRDGKLFLETKFVDSNIFNNEFELSNVDVDFLRGTCNKKVVDKIFGEVIDFERLTVGSKIELKDGTVGRIVILKSKHYMTGSLIRFMRVSQWQVTTIATSDETFCNIEYDRFLTEIKNVIEY